MARVPVTVTGEVLRVTYESEETGFRVIRVGSIEGDPGRTAPLVIIGNLPPVGPGTRVRVTGEVVVDARHGEQLRATSLVDLGPTSRQGLERYIAEKLPGVGPALAKRIVDKFGMDTLTVLDSEPGRLAEVPGLGTRRLGEISDAWAARSEDRVAHEAELALAALGVEPPLARRIVKFYGARTQSIVERHPFRIALEVRGVGFKTADRIAESVGLRGDHPERVQAGTLHVLGELADSGHTLAERPALTERAGQMLGVGADHVSSAIDALWAQGRVVVDAGAVYLARLHEAEVGISESLARLLESPGHELPGLEAAIDAFEARAGFALAPLQREAVRAAALRKVLVVTGGPGVGKTTIVRAILAVLEGARLVTRLAAPTGRAAKRLAEATSREASTLHRLLEFDPKTGAFGRHAEDVLECQALIVDEASMIDVPLAHSLLAALPPAARLVIVGDVDQLPSVGPGAFLRDVITSQRVPTVRLNEIFRQAEASRIVANAHRINHGEEPESAPADAPDADFYLIERRDAERAAETVIELVTSRIPRRFGLDPRADVQVLTPMHRGATGTLALNQALQQQLNPSGDALQHRGVTLRVGDRVMQTKNDYERDVFNGDLGVITRVDPAGKALTATFDERVVEYDGAELDALVLAYATSIHKSQGSEYPAVVIPFGTQHFVMLSRNLLYTAVTRARRLCVLVADKRAIRIALDEQRKDDRFTRLRERLIARLG